MAPVKVAAPNAPIPIPKTMIAKVKPTCKLVHPKNAISGRENKP